MTRVQALFVDGSGVYPDLIGRTDCWANDEDYERWPWAPSDDARDYQGPDPVVAHPPCQLWGAMCNVNFARYGGEHNRPGNDGGRFASALASVRQFGGVLEHPALSRAFAAHGLARPVRGRWTLDGDIWITEVSQCAYGHRARKRTWLAYAGKRAPFDLDWSEPPYTHQIGHDAKRKRPNKLPVLWNKAASATPRLFAETLIHLAEWSRGE